MGRPNPESRTENGANRWGEKKIFTTGEAAEVCKVSQQTIIRCFDSGRIQGFRVPGSRFRRIPREELLRFMRENDIPTDALATGPKRILVVDDEAEILELFRDALARQGKYDVQTASTGYEAGMLTEAFKPDLIILDYMLPDVNGNIVCERIKAHPDMKTTRIIFISGVVNPDEVDQLLQAGADEFIKKPFNIDYVLQRIGQLIEQ